MKITKQRLQRIIQEELQGILLEQDAAFNALPALQQAFEASRFGTGAGGMDAFDDAGKPVGTATNAQLAELAPRVTDQEQLNKMIGFIKKFGGDKVVAHFKNKAKPAAAVAGDASGGTVDPAQKKASAAAAGGYWDKKRAIVAQGPKAEGYADAVRRLRTAGQPLK